MLKKKKQFYIAMKSYMYMAIHVINELSIYCPESIEVYFELACSRLSDIVHSTPLSEDLD